MFFLKELPTLDIMRRYAEQYPEMDLNRTVSALALLRRASFLIRELDIYFQGFGLSQTRFLTLIVLEREPDKHRYSVAELLERIDVSKPVMTTVLRGLEHDGHITIETSNTDRRVKRIAITSEGSALLRQVLPGYFRLISRVVKSWETSDPACDTANPV